MWQIIWNVDGDELTPEDEFFQSHEEARSIAQEELNFVLENIEEVCEMTGMPEGAVPGFRIVQHQVN